MRPGMVVIGGVVYHDPSNPTLTPPNRTHILRWRTPRLRPRRDWQPAVKAAEESGFGTLEIVGEMIPDVWMTTEDVVNRCRQYNGTTGKFDGAGPPQEWDHVVASLLLALEYGLVELGWDET